MWEGEGPYPFALRKYSQTTYGLITTPLRGSRLSQLVGDAVGGQNILGNQ